ncbi:MAG: hypothetical protein Q7K40_05160 [bacterium]|nr:hypothetical protein [bacterium]
MYYINLVDEVTQAEYVGCVEGVSEYFLLPMLQELLESFPFRVIEFHSDNGSEYINHQVAKMLNKMNIDQTKSRSRHSEDNALAEGKNGAIIRKHMGYTHIPRKHAGRINVFCREHLNPYLNYHRFCGFATDYVDERGKVKKKYEVYMTPMQKLMSLPECEQYLNEGVTRETLLAETKRMTHFFADQQVFVERQKLFKEINTRL